MPRISISKWTKENVYQTVFALNIYHLGTRNSVKLTCFSQHYLTIYHLFMQLRDSHLLSLAAFLSLHLYIKSIFILFTCVSKVKKRRKKSLLFYPPDSNSWYFKACRGKITQPYQLNGYFLNLSPFNDVRCPVRA